MMPRLILSEGEYLQGTSLLSSSRSFKATKSSSAASELEYTKLEEPTDLHVKSLGPSLPCVRQHGKG